jgi:hypothetical protein
MKDIVLYCKSYYRDVQRVRRLAESVRRFNSGNLPLYLSCPSDMALLKVSRIILLGESISTHTCKKVQTCPNL